MMMLMGRTPRWMLMMLGLPLAGGVVMHPQSAFAFAMGAGTGVILILPLVWILLWGLRLRSLPQLIRPMLRWHVLLPLAMVGLQVARVHGAG